jgi:hypothetical protein
MAKPGQRHAARTTLIHQRRDAGVNAAQVGIESEAAGHMFVDMGVRIDQAGQHQLSAAVDDVGAGRHGVGPDRGDAAVCHPQVADGVKSRGRIDHPAALQKNISHNFQGTLAAP